MKAKVLLIYPPNQLMSVELLRYDGSLGHLYLAGALRDVGIEVGLLDANVGMPGDNLEETFYRRVEQENGLLRIGMTTDRISQVIANGGYNVVGISSLFTPQTRMALEVAKAAKAVSSHIMVMAGGVNARALAERFLTAGVDVVCNTEGERVVVEIVRAWEQGKSLDVPGTITLQNGRLIKRNPKVEDKIIRLGSKGADTLINLDGLPYPAVDLLPFGLYELAKAAGRDSLEMNVLSATFQTSRGCPFDCDFCHISHEKEYSEESGGIGKLRLKSVNRVMEEMDRLAGLGVKKLFLEDDSAFAKKPRLKEILTRSRDKGLQFADVNGVNLVHCQKRDKSGRLVIDEGLFQLLVDSDFKQLVCPVESASQRIIDKYATGKLNHSTLDVIELVKVATRLGITCPINMMIGFPDETEEEIKASIELGRRLVLAGAPYCSLYIPIPFPGSRLFENALRDGYLSQDFDPDSFNWRKPVMVKTTVAPERIVELQNEGWMSINPPEYVRKRLEMNIGKGRWDSRQAAV